MKLITRIKECKMHSLMYVLGTALAVCYVMIFVIPTYMSMAPIYPENKRLSTYTIEHFDLKQEGQESTLMLSSRIWYEMLSRVKAVKDIAMVGYPQEEKIISQDDKHYKKLKYRRLSPNAFKLYEFDFLEGRPFTWKELEAGKAGAIITEDAAKALFGSAEKVVGRVLKFSYTPMTIQGVVKTPSMYAKNIRSDIYLPMDNLEQLQRTTYYSATGEIMDSKLHRLWDGGGLYAHFAGTAEQAKAVQRELDAMAAAFNNELKADGEDAEIRFDRLKGPFNIGIDDPDKLLELGIAIFVLISLLLLLPVMSLVTLVNWRMTGRIPEMAVRRAFGATRRTLLKEILLENLQLTCIGGLLGLAVAWWFETNWMLEQTNSEGISQSLVSSASTPLEAILSPWMFLVAFLLCVVINLAAALLPTWRMLRKPQVGVSGALGSRHTMFVPGPFRPKELWHSKMQFTKVFIIALVSWIMGVTIGRVLVERYWPGKFDTEHYALLNVEEDPTLTANQEEDWHLEQQSPVIMEEARRLPEVEKATWLDRGYFPGEIYGNSEFTTDTLSETKHYFVRCIYMNGTRFFETLGLKPVQGSPSVEAMDTATVENPCVISRSAAIKAFGTTDVVGRRLWCHYGWLDIKFICYNIVGVVEDVAMGMNSRNTDIVYVTPENNYYSFSTLLLRLKDDCNVSQFCARYNQRGRDERIVSGMYSAIDAQPLSEYCEQHKYDRSNETIANMVLLFLLLNLLFDMVGTFWIRTRGMRGYIGVMRAFGASRRRIVLGLLAEGWLIIVIAFALSSLIWLFLGPYTGLHEDDMWDCFAISIVTFLVLLLTATIGIVIPAWAATKEDITDSIRQE